MEFIAKALHDYVVSHSQEEPPLLKELTRETLLKVLQPRMLSGPLQGRFLSLLSKLISPQHILEVGTFTGYATLCLAEGLAEDGSIDTIDINEELEDFQRNFFDRSAWGDQIHQHIGNAIEIIPRLEKTYDLIFLDADKKNYLNYLDHVLPKLKKEVYCFLTMFCGAVKYWNPQKKILTAVVKEFNKSWRIIQNLKRSCYPCGMVLPQ